MSDLYPIVVCSKGRPTKSPTLQALIGLGEGVEWRVTLEREDVPAYREAGVPANRILELPESNRGIYYTRKFARASMQDLFGLDWMWMLDDDVSKWFQVVDKRCRPTTIDQALLGAQALFSTQPRVALAALEYQQIAWTGTAPIKWDSYADVVVCIHLGRARSIQHREGTKEDRDLAMQVVASGLRVARVQTWAFGCPPIGSNEGGLHDWYSQRENVMRACVRMVELWGPDIVKIVEKPNGLPDAKINWRALRKL